MKGDFDFNVHSFQNEAVLNLKFQLHFRPYDASWCFYTVYLK